MTKEMHLVIRDGQFVPNGDNALSVADWFSQGSIRAHKKVTFDPFVIANAPGEITTLEGKMMYIAGDYIMAGPAGERYPISAEKFAAMKIDNGDGTSSPKMIVKVVKLADCDGSVATPWGTMVFKAGKDYLVLHCADDVGVVKVEIFDQTYVVCS